MTKDEATRRKAYLVQVVVHPHLSNVEKMEKVESFIDKVAGESAAKNVVVLDMSQEASA